MYILKSSDIYNMELTAKENLHIKEEILMENAGIAVYNHIKSYDQNIKNIVILAGCGNNGGDGFVTARHLITNGYNVDIFYSMDKESKYHESAKLNLDILKSINANLYDFSSLNNMDKYNIIVDALFGTGLKREITGIYKNIIDLANSSKAYKIAIDIPSGLISDSANSYATIFQANVTITFSCLKYCLCMYPAKKYAGEIIVKNITIPKSHIENYPHNILITKDNLPKLKIREKDSHKGNFGKVVCIGSSEEMAGALKITSLSAFSSGCGLVTAYHCKNIHRNFISDIPEIMTKAYDYNESYAVINFIEQNATCFTIGNGMGQNSITQEFILNILKNTTKPVVIDADGINACSIDDLKDIKSNNIIMTPHLREFSKLISKSINDIIEDKINIAEDFANKYKITLVLKSADTIIAAPNKKSYIINNGNTALSKGGSGDALTGLIASFMAQGYNQEESCILGAYILGRSSEYAVIDSHPAVVSITNIIKEYKKVFHEL